MQKIITIYIVAVILIVTCSAGSFLLGRKDARDSDRIGANTARETELLRRIGEYESRETERVKRERDRITRTEEAIRGLRETDKRAVSLLQQLSEEIDILAEYFRDSITEYSGGGDLGNE